MTCQKADFSAATLKYFLSHNELYYGSYTAHYFWRKKRRGVVRAFCELLESTRKTGISVLDMGFGCGHDLFLMAKEAKDRDRNVNFFGIDINPEHIEYVQRRADYEGHSNIKLFQGDIQKLSNPFLPATFDFVVCSEVLEHLQEPYNTILEISRLLVPGGQAVVTTPNKRNAMSILVSLFKIKKKQHTNVESDTTEAQASYLGYGHISLKNCHEWVRMFRRADLKIRKVYRGPLIYSHALIDRNPVLLGLLIMFDGLLDMFFPFPQLAFSAIFLLEKPPKKT